MKKLYNIIYADPPWRYDSKQDQYNGKPIHYPAMTTQDICNLWVPKITADNCVLFLWVTPAFLPIAFTVAKCWGFEYKTKAFCWVKMNKKANTPFWGQGYWTRSNSEDCLLFVKGHSKRISASIHQVIISKIEEHSKKPDEVRNRIVQLMGDLPRIELFARKQTPGWDIWGDEV